MTHDRRLTALPLEARVLSVKDAAHLYGVSIPHLRRLYRRGIIPKPFRIGERKLGWIAGDLFADLKRRAGQAEAA